MELIKAAPKTYYIKNPTNIGIYKIDDENVYLIDSGNDKDAGKKILKIVEGQGWKVKGIICTHSNADHIGGNKVIQERTGCKIYAEGIEKDIIENPMIEPAFLFGSKPYKELQNKFLMAKESSVDASREELPAGLEIIPLKGHFFDQIGVKTDDEVYFLADSLFSEETINKYHVFFIYDVKAYLETLDELAKMQGKLFVPSHCVPTTNIGELIELNRKEVLQIARSIWQICAKSRCFEDILKEVFDKYELIMNMNQYVLVGSTVKAYLSYLKEEGKVTYQFVDNKMYWIQV